MSVTSVEEAKMVLPYADIIDLKNPHQGALGALPIESVRQIVSYVNKQKIVSATIGDLTMDTIQDADKIFAAVEAMQATHVDFIKIGFFEAKNHQACLDQLSSLAKAGIKLIAVMFAEKIYPEDLVQKIAEAGFVGVMLDTSEKNGRTLFDYYAPEKSVAFITQVKSKGLKVGIAGSLNLSHWSMVEKLNPDYVGFRGGICESHNRTLQLSEEKINMLCKLL
jgi:uncharacterized protein (UPF0264 family)